MLSCRRVTYVTNFNTTRVPWPWHALRVALLTTFGGGTTTARSHWSKGQKCPLAFGHLVVLFAIFLNSPYAGPLCPSSVQISSNSDKGRDIKACTNFLSYFFKEVSHLSILLEEKKDADVYKISICK